LMIQLIVLLTVMLLILTLVMILCTSQFKLLRVLNPAGPYAFKVILQPIKLTC
jgi:hypothetical protein